MEDEAMVHLIRKRVDAVARAYAARGYTVIHAPQDGDLPDALRGFRPDLVVHNDTEHVVIEVRSRPMLTGVEAMPALARTIAAMSGWRYELVIANPRPAVARLPGVFALTPDETAARIREAQSLFAVQPEAATLLAWSAVEATLRLLAAHERIALERDDPAFILKKLYMYGVLNRDDYDLFLDAVRIRTAIIHGYRSAHRDEAPVAQLVATVERLLRAVDGAIAVA